ncbi:MAG: thermonuclease family protein [Pseudomonadales bacterium]|jgi:micrococcal nuclease
MYRYKAIITRVVDGDTVDVDLDLGFDIWLRNQRIRLYGIDTPESRTRDLEEKKFGMLSKKFVEKYCPIGSEIIVQTHKDDARGKFGRILGELIVEDGTLNLNKHMISEHMAAEYFGQSKDDIEAQHLENRRILYEMVPSPFDLI